MFSVSKDIALGSAFIFNIIERSFNFAWLTQEELGTEFSKYEGFMIEGKVGFVALNKTPFNRSYCKWGFLVLGGAGLGLG